jgi:diguanylate cyclase (GGDEF)-like protein
MLAAGSFVRIKRAPPAGVGAFEGESFAPLVTDGVRDVGFLTALACREFGWGAPTRARLYLVAAGGSAAPSQADVDAAASLLTLVARELGGSIRMASLVEESQRLASTDALTGLANRRHLEELGRRELARARRSGRPLAVALLDVDRFKSINDTLGHAAGDDVLVAMASLLRGVLRDCDAVARWGGEEFCLLLPDTDAAGACVAVARLLACLRAEALPSRVGPVIVTASVGVTVASPAARELEEVLGRADEALYRAKREGRDRWCLALPEPGVAGHAPEAGPSEDARVALRDGAAHPAHAR